MSRAIDRLKIGDTVQYRYTKEIAGIVQGFCKARGIVLVSGDWVPDRFLEVIGNE